VFHQQKQVADPFRTAIFDERLLERQRVRVCHPAQSTDFE
jgi:hypothetical protein